MKKVKIGIIILLVLNIILLVYLWQKEPIPEKTMLQYQMEVENIENIESVLKQYQGSQTIYSLQNAIIEYLQEEGIEQQKMTALPDSISNGDNYIAFQLQVESKTGNKSWYQIKFYHKANSKKSVEINRLEGGN